MAQIITAPSIETPVHKTVFLAGGITGCKDWQSEVIKELICDDITIFNPRQEHFDITDTSAADKQIAWEYKRLEQMDVFSMYFCASDSDQPICMYELGRNIVHMQNRFPSSWENRIIISVEDGYKRKKDVIVQVGLCAPKLLVACDVEPIHHALRIRGCAEAYGSTII